MIAEFSLLFFFIYLFPASSCQRCSFGYEQCANSYQHGAKGNEQGVNDYEHCANCYEYWTSGHGRCVRNYEHCTKKNGVRSVTSNARTITNIVRTLRTLRTVTNIAEVATKVIEDTLNIVRKTVRQQTLCKRFRQFFVCIIVAFGLPKKRVIKFKMKRIERTGSFNRNL